MKLGIMQPYFFAYAQQFRHISECDQWIIFDTPKYSRKSWLNRNRICNLNSEWSYISVPVAKGASKCSIQHAEIGNSDWRANLLDKLRVYRHIAPFYEEAIEFVDHCITPEANTIADLNSRILSEVCTLLKIPTPIFRLSELSLALPETAEPGEWALIISKAFGADIYSNAAGGRHLFDPQIYQKYNIDLEFYEPRELTYATHKFKFVPDLSIVDSLMWISVDHIKNWVHGN